MRIATIESKTRNQIVIDQAIRTTGIGTGTGAAKARHIQCTLDQYHARDEWSHSQEEDAIGDEGSWPLFYGRHVAKPPLFPRKTSGALDAGTVAHTILTSPGSVDDVVAIIPEDVLNKDGHRKGQPWKDWSAENAGRIQMKAAECEPIRQMVRNVYAHPRGRWLMEHILHAEFTLVWTDEETGLELRARPDFLIQWHGRIFVVDFKTTRCRTPRTFIKAAGELGYHRQLAWYSEPVELFGYEVAPQGIFLTSDKSPAHECRVYELPEHDIELGHRENAAFRRALARRLAEDDWTDPLSQEAIEIALPRWVHENERLAV
jgi:hypothetical protein